MDARLFVAQADSLHALVMGVAAVHYARAWDVPLEQALQEIGHASDAASRWLAERERRATGCRCGDPERCPHPLPERPSANA